MARILGGELVREEGEPPEVLDDEIQDDSVLEYDDEVLDDEIQDDSVLEYDDEDLDDSETEPEDKESEEEQTEVETIKEEKPKGNRTISQMRQELLEQKKQLQQFQAKEEERQQQEVQQRLANAPLVKPTFESCGFDPDVFEAKTVEFLQAQNHREQIAQQEAAVKQKADRLWIDAQSRYAEGRKTVGVKDYSVAESIVETELSRQQVNWLLVSTNQPNKIVYALGKDEKRLAELKKAQTPFEFAAMIGRIEATMGDIVKKKAVEPEKRAKVGPGASSGVSSSKQAIDKAIAEAQRTGNIDNVRELMRKQKK